MKYKTYLQNKNLSTNTINIYFKNYEIWKKFLNKNNPSKKIFIKFIKKYEVDHKPASVNLMYHSILSIFKFEKRWKLLNECRDIKLPKQEVTLQKILPLSKFEYLKNKIKLNNWYQQRNWLIFCFMFFTGIRVSELFNINTKSINNQTLLVYGKGKKTRLVYINDYLQQLLNNWKNKRIPVSKKGKLLTYKQVNNIVKKLSNHNLNINLSPHSLRRSYATNLIKNNINLEIVRKTLGHSSINTTSRYIQYTDEEILAEIKNCYNSL